MDSGRNSSGTAGALALLGVGAVLVLCCAAPALIAAGALGVLGGALRSGWLIGASVLVVLAALSYALHRHARRAGAPDCCPPPPDPTNRSRLLDSPRTVAGVNEGDEHGRFL
ncbi:Mercuric transporter MerT [Mycobacteroides abscessus subsp. massiliense]|nr:Mercuric transporter MerT [Mycobacteroides abscessus subsp. massiliense]